MMQLKCFFLATVISVITTLFVADVSTAQPKFLFDKTKDIRDRVENRKDVRDRIDDRKDTRKEHFNHFPSGNRGSNNFFPNRFPFPKKS